MTRMRHSATLLLAALAINAGSAAAYPVIDRVVPTGGQPIKVYPDHLVDGVFWYIPQSIEPWSRDNTFKSQLSYKKNKYLSFIFRGQASVERKMLEDVAKAIGTSVDNMTPIAYDSSENLVCQNIYTGLDVTWLFPPRIGNYLEVVPVSIRTTNPDLMEEINDLVTGNGLACTVDVTFKAVSTGYHVTMYANMNEVYERFEMGAHAEYWIWEVDIHAVVQKLISDGVIRIEKFEDPEFAQTPLDQQIAASYEEVTKQVLQLMFKPAPALPAGGIAGRGKAFSLRMDYQKSELHRTFQADLSSRYVSKKTSQIGLRLAVQ